MNQISENGKKTNFGPDFGPFRPKLSLQAIFRGKLMNQTWENGKKN